MTRSRLPLTPVPPRLLLGYNSGATSEEKPRGHRLWGFLLWCLWPADRLRGEPLFCGNEPFSPLVKPFLRGITVIFQ